MAEQVISWNDINTQYIDEGDLAYVVPMTSGKNYFDQEPELLGKVINVSPSEIRVETEGTVLATTNDFIMFSKPVGANESSLKGYYADVTFENHSSEYAELFAISSEVVPSSK